MMPVVASGWTSGAINVRRLAPGSGWAVNSVGSVAGFESRSRRLESRRDGQALHRGYGCGTPISPSLQAWKVYNRRCVRLRWCMARSRQVTCRPHEPSPSIWQNLIFGTHSRPPHVCFPPDSGQTRDIANGPFRAVPKHNVKERCAFTGGESINNLGRRHQGRSLKSEKCHTPQLNEAANLGDLSFGHFGYKRRDRRGAVSS